MRRHPAAGLTASQDEFARQYVLNDGNATLSYKRAFPASSGAKSKTTGRKATRLLAEPKVMARIEHYRSLVRAQLEEEFKVESALVLRELAAIAFLDVRDLAEWGYERVPHIIRGKQVEIGGVPLYRNQPFLRWKPSDRLTRDEVRAIAQVQKETGRDGAHLLNVVLASKERALIALARHCGLLADRVEHSGKVPAGPIIVMASPAEAEV